MRLRPFFSYFGAKWKLAPKYPAPEHRAIVEPFAGSACYSLLYPDRNVLLIDKDPSITTTWEYLTRVRPDEILGLPDLEPDQSISELSICEEAKLLIGWWCGRASYTPRARMTGWGRAGTYPSHYWGPTVRSRIASQLEHIRHWSISLGDYRDAPDVEATWFVDPPYQGAGVGYTFSSTGLDYGDLALWCKSRRGQTIVCENAGANWLPFTTLDKVNTVSGSKSVEAIWTGENMNIGEAIRVVADMMKENGFETLSLSAGGISITAELIQSKKSTPSPPQVTTVIEKDDDGEWVKASTLGISRERVEEMVENDGLVAKAAGRGYRILKSSLPPTP